MNKERVFIGLCVFMSCIVMALFVGVVSHIQEAREERIAATTVSSQIARYERGQEDEELLADLRTSTVSEVDVNEVSLCLDGEQEVLSCQLSQDGKRLAETVSVCICRGCERGEVADEPGDSSGGSGVLVYRGGVAPFASSAGRVSLVWDKESLKGFNLGAGSGKGLNLTTVQWEGEPKDVSVMSGRGLLKCEPPVRVDFRGLLDFKEE